MSVRALEWASSLRAGLSPLEKVVLEELADRVPRFSDMAWPTIAEISDSREVSIRSVCRALKLLRTRGIIIDTGKRHFNHAIVYRLAFNETFSQTEKAA